MAKHGKTKTHKAQHFVSQAYLKAWLDPTAPASPVHTPYVWVIDKDGSNARKKAPKSIFTETDIYTIAHPDGTRDLRLEHGLSEIEDRFTRVRNLKLRQRLGLDGEDFDWLYLFAATAQLRTASFRDFHSAQWRRVRERGEDLERAMRGATQKQRDAMAHVSRSAIGSESPGISLQEVRKLETETLQRMLPSMLKAVFPIMRRMHWAVLCTEDPIGFVTTDRPCTWFDPEAYKLPPLYRGVGIGVRTIETTLPLSPSQCLLLTHIKHLDSYTKVPRDWVDMLNRRHIGHAGEHFVSKTAETRTEWFVQAPVPDDAWEANSQAAEIPQRAK